ncbi:MAG TPA: CHASE2 domain-containing protein [Gammaproteobacteria bacterium]|nr:CHASE2 domain-containing protein [Gammaproteobacteria bacterium]
MTSLVLSALWGGAAQLDPFGLKTAADLQSEAVFMRMVGGPWYKSTARDKITVILVNDAYLDETGEAWPMSYLQQDLLLTDILGYQPKAVFIDFLYRHQHGSDAEIAQLAETIRMSVPDTSGKRIPVFLPFLTRDIPGISSCESSSAKPLRAADIVQKNSVLEVIRPPQENRTYIGWNGCGDRYPMYLAGNKELPTPAFAMYRHYCQQAANASSSACQAILDGNSPKFSHPMVIRWGTGVSELHDDAMSRGAVECTRSAEINRFTYPLTQLAMAIGQSFSSNRERGQAERCTYTDTLYATWLLGASSGLHEFLETMIKDRYVFIGTKVAGVSDVVLSPVNGQVPGVYLFAMSLDNLITMGNNYFTELKTVNAGLLEIAILFVIIFSARFLRAFIFCNMGIAPSVLIYKIALPLSISLAAAVPLWYFRVAPMDWITVAFLGFVANPVKLSDCGNHSLTDKIYKTLAPEGK